MSGDIAGWFLAISCYALLLLSKPLSQDRKSLFIAWSGISLHHIIAYYQSYVFPVYGARDDAISFYKAAALGLDNNYLAMFYTKAMRVVFLLLEPSMFLGCQLSIVAFSLTLFGLYHLGLETLDPETVKRVAPWSFGLYGLLPGPAVHTAVTLRESFQSLFLVLTLWTAIRLIHQAKLERYIHFSLCALGLALLHNGLAAYVAIAWPIVLLWDKKNRKNSAIFVVAVLGVALALGILPQIRYLRTNSIRAIIRGRAIDYVRSYRNNIGEARSHYGVELDTSSKVRFLYSGVKIVMYYVIAPLPHQISSPLDIYAAGENLIRLYLFWGFILHWRSRRDKEDKHIWTLLLCSFILVELLWSFGTTNWGTALRHHIPAFSVLTLFGLVHHYSPKETAKAPPIKIKDSQPKTLESSPENKVLSKRSQYRKYREQLKRKK